MSFDFANKFLADVKAWKVGLDISKVNNVTDHAAAMKYMHSFGYDFTEEEMLQALNDLNMHGKKISMAGAEAVAGGSTNQWVSSGGAVAAATASAAACAWVKLHNHRWQLLVTFYR